MKHKKIIAVALIALFVFSPISFSNIYVLSQTVPFEDITGYQEWNQSRTVDKVLLLKRARPWLLIKVLR